MYIYALIFNDEIVYIGKTQDPEQRYKEHLRSVIGLERPRKQNIHDFILGRLSKEIVRDVLFNNVKMRILKSDLQEDQVDREERLSILEYVEKGYNLQNNCDWYWFCKTNLTTKSKMDFLDKSMYEIKTFLSSNNGVHMNINGF